MSDTQENSPFEPRHENNQFCSVYLLSVHAKNVCFFIFFRENWGIHGNAFFCCKTYTLCFETLLVGAR